MYRNRMRRVYLQFAAGQSCIVTNFAYGQKVPKWNYYHRRGEALPLAGTWKVNFVKGGPTLPQAAEIEKLQSWTEFAGEEGKAFSGTATYTLDFAKPSPLTARSRGGV